MQWRHALQTGDVFLRKLTKTGWWLRDFEVLVVIQTYFKIDKSTFDETNGISKLI